MTQDLVPSILTASFTKAEALRKLKDLKGAVSLNTPHSPKTDEAFQKAEKEIREIEPLVIFLPFDLPEEKIPQLGALVRQNFGPKFLMEIKYDPSLIAGAALAWKGIYKDYSVKSKIKDIWKLVL